MAVLDLGWMDCPLGMDPREISEAFAQMHAGRGGRLVIFCRTEEKEDERLASMLEKIEVSAGGPRAAASSSSAAAPMDNFM